MKSSQASSGHGGSRENAGRRTNTQNKMSKEMREAAAATGRLPHEILLDIARGNPQTIMLPKPDGTVEKKLVGVSLEQVADAAKAAAPYYAPKISTVEVIHGVSDADLDEFIARAAAEAGVSVSASGEGEAGEDQAGPAGAASQSRKRVQLRD